MCHLPPRPLQALNDSRLGDAVIGGGMDDDLKQPCFTVGLKGVEAANVDKVGVLAAVWRRVCVEHSPTLCCRQQGGDGPVPGPNPVVN